MGIALVVAFLLGLAIGFPVSLSMGGSGLLALLVDGKLSLLTVPQRFFNGINSFPLMAVPFFILAADLMSASGITLSLLRFTTSVVGHIRGGLGHVNILTLMLFAGISGSALADAADPGALIMRMMKRAGYDEYYSAALTASTAIMGPIIPPSIIMVIYAITDSKVTVAGLFLAGVVPGVLMGLALAVLNHVTATRRHYLFRSPLATWEERLTSVGKAIPALLMPVIIIGGILGGIFTATEALAVAVFYALFVGFVITKKLTLRNLPKVVVQSALVTSAALLIVSMASLFANILTVVQVPQTVAAYITEISRDPTVVMTDDHRGDLRSDLRDVYRHAAGRHHPGSGVGPLGRYGRHRPFALRHGLRAQYHDRHDHAAGGGRPLYPHGGGAAEFREALAGRPAHGVGPHGGAGDGDVHPGNQPDAAAMVRVRSVTWFFARHAQETERGFCAPRAQKPGRKCHDVEKRVSRDPGRPVARPPDGRPGSAEDPQVCAFPAGPT